MIRLAPEGWPFVIPGLILTGIAAVVGILVPEANSVLRTGLLGAAGILGLLTAFILWFFRDPIRKRHDAERLVLAPGDGRIVQITPMEEPSFFQGPATRVSIFLSVFNVHIQRAPISGRVELKKYEPGGFAVAWKPKASEDNEQSTLGIVAGPQRVMVRQIAGLIARRIVTDPEVGELVPQGSRIGIIRFGSRVDLFIPRDWEVTCKIGDKVRGGLTALARIPQVSEGVQS